MYKHKRVNHDVISGLKYLHAVKRKGIRVDKMEEMIGSYGPSSDVYEKKVIQMNIYFNQSFLLMKRLLEWFD